MIPKMPGKRTLVEPLDQRVSAGGIIMAAAIRSGSALEGTIIAVGPGCDEAKVGDRISFAPFGKYTVPKEDGDYKNHLIVNEEDILITWVEEKKPKKKKKELENA